MSSRKLALACYRAILRWSASAKGTPFHVKRDHLAGLSSALAESNAAIHDAETLRSVTRWIFREQQDARDAQAQEAVASALAAVKLLNTEYGPKVVELQKKRGFNMDRKGIRFHIGEVVENIKENFHGIVVGWDRVCKKPAMVKHKDLRFDQPFYQILPDQQDSVRAWGIPRVFAYVAQDHLQHSLKPKQILSGSLSNYFEAYSTSRRRYIPKYYLRFEYPDNYEAADAVPCDGGLVEDRLSRNAKTKRRKSGSESPTSRRSTRKSRKAIEDPSVGSSFKGVSATAAGKKQADGLQPHPGKSAGHKEAG